MQDRKGEGKAAIATGRPYIWAEEDQIPVARAKQHQEDNCYCTDKTTRRQLTAVGRTKAIRRGRRYGHNNKADGEGTKGANKA